KSPVQFGYSSLIVRKHARICRGRFRDTRHHHRPRRDASDFLGAHATSREGASPTHGDDIDLDCGDNVDRSGFYGRDGSSPARDQPARLAHCRWHLAASAVDRHGIRAQSGIRSPTETETAEAAESSDVAVFPLAIPLIAGPGAITSLILLMGRA